MSKNFIESAKQEYSAYKGLGKLVDRIKERGLNVDPVVLSQLNKIAEREGKLETLVNKGENMTLSDFAIQYTVFQRSNRFSVDDTIAGKMNAFFSNRDQSVVSAEEWKSLYKAYLKSTVKEDAAAEQWYIDGAFLDERLNNMIRGFSTIELRTIDKVARDAAQDYEAAKLKVENHSVYKKLEELGEKFKSQTGYSDTPFTLSIYENNRDRFQKDYDNLKSFLDNNAEEITKELFAALDNYNRVFEKRDTFKRNEKELYNKNEEISKLTKQGYKKIMEDPAYRDKFTEEERNALLNDDQLLDGVEDKFMELEGDPIYDEIFENSTMKELNNEVGRLREWIYENENDVPTEDEVEDARNDYNREVKNVNDQLESQEFRLFDLMKVSKMKEGSTDSKENILANLKKALDREKEFVDNANKNIEDYYNLQAAKEELRSDPEYVKLVADCGALKEKMDRANKIIEDRPLLVRDYKEWKGRINLDRVHENLIDNVRALYNQRELNKGFHINSKEYSAMELAMKIVATWREQSTQDLVKANAAKGYPQTIEDAGKLLVKATQAYLDAKHQQDRNRPNPSLLRQTRFAFAEELLEIATEAKNIDDIVAPKQAGTNPEAQANANPVVNKPEKQSDISVILGL